MRRFLPVNGDAVAMAIPSPPPDAAPVLDAVEPPAPAYEPTAAATGAANSALFLDSVGPAASAPPSASAFSGTASGTAAGFVVPPLSHPPGPTSCSVSGDRKTLGVAPGTAPVATSSSAFHFGKPPCSGSGMVSGSTSCAAPPASATIPTLACCVRTTVRAATPLSLMSSKQTLPTLNWLSGLDRLKHRIPPQPHPALILGILRSLWMSLSRGCPP